MKRVIKGKLYDTDRAKLIHCNSGASLGYAITEEMYRKRTGEYFLLSTFIKDDLLHHEIKPLTTSQAQEWLEKNGVILTQGAGKIQLALHVPRCLVEKLRAQAADKGLSMSALATSILNEYFKR